MLNGLLHLLVAEVTNELSAILAAYTRTSLKKRGGCSINTSSFKEQCKKGNDIYTSCTQQLHSHKIHWSGAHTLSPTPMCLVCVSEVVVRMMCKYNFPCKKLALDKSNCLRGQ
jgi:hypothetical protein